MAHLMEVRPSYLQALERGELGRNLSPGYVKNLLVRYGDHLGLDAGQLLRDYAAAEQFAGRLPLRPTVDAIVSDNRRAKPRMHRRILGPRRKQLGLTLGALIAAAVAVAAVFQSGVLDDPSPETGTGGTRPRTSTTVFASGLSTEATTVTTVAPPPTTVTTDGGAIINQSSTTTSEVGATASATFLTRLTPEEDVWLELTEEGTNAVLYEGTRIRGDALELEPAGPVRVVIGKPGAVTVIINGRTMETPGTARWLLTEAGVSAR